MNRKQRTTLFVTRVLMGWLFFYAGITKVLDPEWTSAGYLINAKTFSGLYTMLAHPSVVHITDFLNQWGLTLIGASLIVGLFVRYSGMLGALMMLLYYLPILDFPYPNTHSFIVDEHIIYAVVLVLLAVSHAGNYWGIDKFLHGKKQ